uniref:Cystatin domain-containing protein n=1 Tax=Kalanchoe fedtschenkoi TaxID=63787 RepID=A0A7N0U3S6_KALFE
MNSQTILITVVALMAWSALEVRASGAPGGWFAIGNLTDPHVIEVSKFAVAEHNKQANETLVFDGLINGEVQSVQGTVYRLRIDTKRIDGAYAGEYEATVVEPLPSAITETSSLCSFRTILYATC